MEYSMSRDAFVIGSSVKGGFNRKQLRMFGIHWPPMKGWFKRAVNGFITEEQYAEFLRLSNRGYSKSFIEHAVDAFKSGDFSGLGIPIPEIKSFIQNDSTVLNEKIAVTAASSLEGKDIIIYTDGACLPNPGGKGGWAFIATWADRRLSRAGFYPNTTNNRMELMAAIEAIKAVREKVDESRNKIGIYTDSQYIILCVQNYGAWKARKKKSIPNEDLIQQLVMLSERLSVDFQWVRGHNGNEFNEECDFLANRAAELQQPYKDYARIR
jgi:ribonuclease HI